MTQDVVQLTKEIVSFESESRHSNVAVTDFLEDTLKKWSFEIERLEYDDENGERKASLVAKKGASIGGFALISHSDTVPGSNWDRDPWTPAVENGRVIGLGACDMKGPMAATMIAAAETESSQLKQPVYIVITSDEESGGYGIKQVVGESELFNTNGPEFGVIAEPTQMVPVYAHKGGGRVIVTAHGRAAHTSTERGISANFLIAPFLAEMAELSRRVKTDESFMDQEFDPPTNGFNMVLDDGGCRPNVSAAKTTCTLSFRTMPKDNRDELLQIITDTADRYGFESDVSVINPFYTLPDSEIVQHAIQATGATRAETVPYGTDAFFMKAKPQLVVLGPGNIEQAHTNGEWIEIDQLNLAVDVYKKMISRICM